MIEYNYEVPDPENRPKPTISTIRPEDRQEYPNIAAMLETKRNERLKTDPRYLQLEADVNMDQIVEEKYERIGPDLQGIINEYENFNPRIEGNIDILFEKESNLRA